MPVYDSFLVGDRTDEAFFDATSQKYVSAMVFPLLFWLEYDTDEHPELRAATHLLNSAAPNDDEVGRAYIDAANAGWPMTAEHLWFLWRDQDHCHEPRAAAAALDHLAELLLTQVDRLPWLESCINAATDDFGWPRGQPIDLDWAYDDVPEEIWPSFIWTARGLAKAARQAAESGSTKVTVLITGLG